jgi:hypothetical protein
LLKGELMRQAILITAYKNEKQIYDIINYFGKDFEFYIHVDKKSSMNLSKNSGGAIYTFIKNML